MWLRKFVFRVLFWFSLGCFKRSFFNNKVIYICNLNIWLYAACYKNTCFGSVFITNDSNYGGISSHSTSHISRMWYVKENFYTHWCQSREYFNVHLMHVFLYWLWLLCSKMFGKYRSIWLKINVSVVNISMYTLFVVTVQSNDLITESTSLVSSFFIQSLLHVKTSKLNPSLEVTLVPPYDVCCWWYQYWKATQCFSSLQIYFFWNFFLFLLPAPCAAFSARMCWYFFLLLLVREKGSMFYMSALFSKSMHIEPAKVQDYNSSYKVYTVLSLKWTTPDDTEPEHVSCSFFSHTAQHDAGCCCGIL